MLISINNETFPLTIIRKKSGLEKGLKYETNIIGCYLFMMGEIAPQSFWMKDCLVPIDIVFCENNQIKKIYHHCDPCDQEDCPRYTHTANIVLEFKGNTCIDNNIKEGDHFEVLM